MEYCITLLVETFLPGPTFRVAAPIQTAWGEAWRAKEQGRHFWPGGLYVERIQLSPHLLSHLSPSLHNLDWQSLSIGGHGLQEFEDQVNSTDGVADTADLNQHPLLLLLQELLNGQQRWAVFFQNNCEDIACNLQRPLAELPPIVIEAYRWNSDQSRGFCCSGKM